MNRALPGSIFSFLFLSFFFYNFWTYEHEVFLDGRQRPPLANAGPQDVSFAPLFPGKKWGIRGESRRARRQVACLTRWQRRVSARGQGASHLPAPPPDRSKRLLIRDLETLGRSRQMERKKRKRKKCTNTCNFVEITERRPPLHPPTPLPLPRQSKNKKKGGIMSCNDDLRSTLQIRR